MSLEVVPGPPDVCVLAASGELDAVVTPGLIERVETLVDGAAAVVLDLSAVSFLDSSGLRLVDRLARECGRRGAPVRIVAPLGSPSRRLLEIVVMAGELVAADRPTAEAAVRAQLSAAPAG